jgi:hypothetical protein
MIKKNSSYTNDVYNTMLTLSNPIFLSPAYSPALICFGRKRGWWITCNCPTVLKEKNMEKQKDCAICWLKSVLHEEKRRTGSDSGRTQQKPCRASSDIGAELENHTVGRCPTQDRKRSIAKGFFCKISSFFKKLLSYSKIDTCRPMMFFFPNCPYCPWSRRNLPPPWCEPELLLGDKAASE